MIALLKKLTLSILFAACLAGCTSHATHPIVGANGSALPDSVASLEPVTLGGVKQWILIRGENRNNPILLKLHGGPGQAEMATVGLNKLLEKDFVVVEWDQRGAGKSADAIEPQSGMTLARFVEDTHELSELLLKRFHQNKLILVGHSWGSVIGLKAVQQYPQLYSAFVSTGQIADFSEGLNVTYRHLIDEAKRTNHPDALKALTEIGPPPYMGEDGKAKRNVFGKWLMESGGFWHSDKKFDRIGWMISSVEYSWYEKLRYTGAAEKSFELLLSELAKVHMETEVPKVEVPVYFVAGRYDYMAPVSVSERYFSNLSAPKKEWIWFEHSAHFPQWEEMERFHEVLTKQVVPSIYSH